MGAFPTVAAIYSSGLNLCSLPFVKQDSAAAFAGLERYLTLPLSSGGMWQPACWKVVQQWSTSKADMVNYFCKALNTEWGWKWECWPLWRQPQCWCYSWERLCNNNKKGQRIIASVTINVDWGEKKRQFFLQSRFTSITLQFFFSLFKGNLLSVAKWP